MYVSEDRRQLLLYSVLFEILTYFGRTVWYEAMKTISMCQDLGPCTTLKQLHVTEEVPSVLCMVFYTQ